MKDKSSPNIMVLIETLSAVVVTLFVLLLSSQDVRREESYDSE